MSFLYSLGANAIALFIVSRLLDGIQFEGGILGYLIVGAILTLLNFSIKPILKVISFPLVFLTGGLFLIVINALILFLAQRLLTIMDFTGIAMKVDGALTYLLGAVIFGIANWLIHWLLKDD